MQALVRGSAHYGAAVRLNHVDEELAELGRSDRVMPVRRQRLLKIIHAARAIDTTLGVILDSNGKVPLHGIGKRLDQLKTLSPAARGYMNHPTVVAFRSSIANVRNDYVHKAGLFPTSTQEVDTFVSEVHACMTLIL
jgi:hypothetical protein